MTPALRRRKGEGVVEVDVAKAGRFAIGAALTVFGFVVSYGLGRQWEVVDGVRQIHYDHPLLYSGNAISIFGALMWGPGYAKEAFRYVAALLAREPIRRSSHHRRADD